MDLYEEAKKKNVVAFLGSKVYRRFISLCLVNHFAHQIRSHSDKDDAHHQSTVKCSVIIVPDERLISQEATTFKNHTDLSVGEYSDVDYSLEPDYWISELCKNQILLMKCSLFVDLLSNCSITLSSINVIILHDCQRVLQDDSYKKLASFLVSSDGNQTRLLGFGPSLFYCNRAPNEIKSILTTIESLLKASSDTLTDLRTSFRSLAKPVNKIMYFTERPVPFELHCSEKIHQILFSLIKFITSNEKVFKPSFCLDPRTIISCFHDVFTTMTTMGPWCAAELADIYAKELAEFAADASREQYLSGILTSAMSFLQFLYVSLKSQLAYLYFINQQLQAHSSDKMVALLKILLDFAPNPEEEARIQNEVQTKFSSIQQPNLCGIIFANDRSTVRLLSSWLQAVSTNIESFKFLKVDYLVDCLHFENGLIETKKPRTSGSRQENVLLKFRKHEINLLVATSNFEEELDLPRCNLVIRYDFPETFAQYLFAKQRIRAEKGKFVLLMPKEDSAYSELEDKLVNYLSVENIIKQIANKNKISPEEREKQDEKLLSPKELSSLYPPYTTSKGITVDLDSALAILHRYCLRLPSDTFTRLTPLYEYEKIDDKYERFIIRLPTNSPVRDPIKGPPAMQTDIAQKAAALQACTILHTAGELNDSLYPVSKENNKYLEELGIQRHKRVRNADDNETRKNQERPGTTKRRQNYEKRIAEALRGPGLAPNEPYYLYVFLMTLTCPMPEEQNTRGRKLIDPMDTSRFFGFITRSEVPKICDFPVYTRSGEVMVSMRCVSQGLSLSAQQIAKIQDFHRFTFNDVLHLIKDPMEFDPSSSLSSFYVIPVDYHQDSKHFPSSSSDLSHLNVCIDWAFIEKVLDYEKTDFRLKKSDFTFNKLDFEDAVVKPSYRSAKEQLHFYVADICDNLKPTSPFPTDIYQTFHDYYLQKYNIEIKDINQPLLDVDHTSARLNLLTPRFVNRKGMPLPKSTEKTRVAKRENLQSKQLLVPELCIVHPFPASFWNKAVCLPSIIYRVNHLLLAEQLRQEVASKIGIGICNPGPSFNWPPLDFGWSLVEVIQFNLEKEQLNEQLNSSRLSLSPEPRKPSQLKTPKPSQKLPATPPSLPVQPASQIDKKFEPIIPLMEDDNCDDLLIDTFDPNVYKVEDPEPLDDIDDDFFGEIPPVGDWDDIIQDGTFEIGPKSIPIQGPIANWIDKEPKIKDLPNDYQVKKQESECRVGSPSNFEQNPESNWDNWVPEDQGSRTVIDLGIPGLNFISASGGLDLHKLSKDLENIQTYEDFDESEDEEELNNSDYDLDGRMDEDSLFIPDSEDVANTNVKEELRRDILSSGLIISSQMANNSSSSTEKQPKSIFDEIDLSSTVSEDKTKATDCDRENIKKLFEYDEVIIPSRDEGNFDAGTFAKEIPVIDIIDEIKDSLNQMVPKKFQEKAEDGDKNVLGTKMAASESVVSLDNKDIGPSFGELLPNRDEIAETSDCADITPPSLIHLDPLNKEFDASQGPSPALILQALTMSNASDGINLERLETVGDSFLKYAVTAFMYCRCPDQHEGILSQLRSTQISNLKLYELGSLKKLGELMVATKFEPSDNWLPPGFKIPIDLEKTNDSGEKSDLDGISDKISPFNCLLTQQVIPDKSIADCVEALIGAYLISCGPRGAILFMRWLGLMVMDDVTEPQDPDGMWHWLREVKPPLLPNASKDELNCLYKKYGLDRFEKEIIGYEFKDKAFLVQAFTHNSFSDNHVTDCYQRLEFLGDAVLDFLITRHLYDDPRKHSPGVLTDLRSALANNTFFASLAVEYEFHKYLMYKTAELHIVISKFVESQGTNGEKRDPADLVLLLSEADCEQPEDIEVPKALGDIFESVAGAIFLDSGFSLDTVWKVYYKMMKPEMEYYSKNPPKSPIRELLEMKPQKVSFSKPEEICSHGTHKFRISVDVFGVGKYYGVGRNSRLAKYTAAKRALRQLKFQHKNQLQTSNNNNLST